MTKREQLKKEAVDAWAAWEEADDDECDAVKASSKAWYRVIAASEALRADKALEEEEEGGNE